MAVLTVKGSKNIPQGATRLTETEALTHQYAIIRDWKIDSDVYGRHMSVVLSGICSCVAVSHIRTMLRVQNRGRIFCHLPGVVISTVFSWNYFPRLVTNNIVLMKDNCPLCQQLKFLGFNLCSSIAYSSLMGALISSAYATENNTYHVPDLQKQPKEFFKLIWKFCKVGRMKFQVLATAELLFVLFVPYMQNTEFINITKTFEARNYNENLPPESVKSVSLEYN